MSEAAPQQESAPAVDVDALEASISEAPSGPSGSDRPLRDAPSPQQQAQAQAAAELGFKWNGKDIKVPLNDPRATQWLSQGYDYAQKMAQFKAQTQEWEQKQQMLQSLEQKYKPVEEYIQKDPNWWNHVQESYQKKQQGFDSVDPNNPLTQEIASLRSQLGEIAQFKNELLQEREAKQRAEMDAQVEASFKSIKEAYPDIDFAALDDSGKSLEMKILEHALNPNADRVKSAFRDFYHDELVKREANKAKELMAKEAQKKTKLGLLSESTTPKLNLESPQDLKKKSYEDIHNEILKELGIA